MDASPKKRRLRAWHVLVAAGFAALTCSASAQDLPRNPVERSNEVLRRLALPPDPVLEKQASTLHNKANACLEKQIAADPENKNIAQIACTKCDREIVETAKVFYAANKHRYINLNEQQSIASNRDHCVKMQTFGVILKERYRLKASREAAQEQQQKQQSLDIAVAARPAVVAWTACVVQYAREWSSGPDSADAVAAIAADSCPQEKAAAGRAMQGMKTSVIVSVMDILYRENRQLAAMAVLEARKSTNALK